MARRPKIFLDPSALSAGIWSAQGGARAILHLGELGAIAILLNSQVISEIERALRQKAPGELGSLALLLDRAQVEICEGPSEKTLHECQQIIPISADALSIASAWDAGVDYFVTLDRRHFLENFALREAVPFPLGTPGDFLDCFKPSIPMGAQ